MFNNKQKTPDLALQNLLSETKNRWFVFLDKLEAKMQELCEAAIPELKEMFSCDEDVFKRKYHQICSGIKGQLGNIRQKANETYEEKVSDFVECQKQRFSFDSLESDCIYEFRNECAQRQEEFDEKYNYWNDMLAKTGEEDLEIKYQNILKEYESIKNQFQCTQCGGKMEIHKLFFISAYIACPYCQSQNTFEPSTMARSLEFISRDLARQRTSGLLKEYEIKKSKERELYHRKHEIDLSTIHEKDKKILAEKKQQEESLEKQRQESIKNAHILYESYLRAYFNELNKIMPDFTEHNEKLYHSQLQEYKASI